MNLQTRPNPNVPLEDFRKLCEVAPQPWKALFALCRLAGLRRSEAVGLPWNGTAVDREGMELPVGIDFDAKRIRVVGKGDRYREVPIRPELDDILAATLTEARGLRFSDNDAKVTHLIKDDKNLIYKMQEFAKAAGLEPWRKPYQSLRSSCENEWKALGIAEAEATYLAWIGHGVEVSRRHYVSPLDSEFEAVTG